MNRIAALMILVLFLFSAFIVYKYFELNSTSKRDKELTEITLKISHKNIVKGIERLHKLIDQELQYEPNYGKLSYRKPYYARSRMIKQQADSIIYELRYNLKKNKSQNEIFPILKAYIKKVEESFDTRFKQEYKSILSNSEIIASANYSNDSLNLLKNEILIRTLEYEVAEHTYFHIAVWRSSRGQNYIAMVRTSTPVIQLGEKYESEIFLGNYDTKQSPSAKVNGDYLVVRSGIAKYSARPSKTGKHTYEGELKIMRENGQTEEFPFTSSYLVVPKITNMK